MATIHRLHSGPTPVTGYLRIGHTEQRKLETLHAAGRLPFQRLVFDAAHVAGQSDLLKAMTASGAEIVLDPNFAEMATVGKFASATAKLPWANAERPWEPSDFSRQRNLDIAKAIADFAVSHSVTVVLALTHLIDDVNSPWRLIDLALVEALRRELDHAGGAGIAIDYQLLTTAAVLKDERSRTVLMEGVGELPIQNVWLRVSGFAATSTGMGTRHFIEATRSFAEIGRPLIADCTGGLAALAALAFGAIGGLCHGAGQRESFKAANWYKPPTSSGGGSAPRIYVPELDRYLIEEQLQGLLDVRGGRARLACNDTSCCPHGGESMIDNPTAHFLTQRDRQFKALSKVPDSRRAEYYLLHQLDPALRSARAASKLKITDAALAKVVADAKARLLRMRDVLGHLHEVDTSHVRSREPSFRPSETTRANQIPGRA